MDLNNILASGIIQNDAEMVKLIFFGNLSVHDFSFDEFALLAAPENWNYSGSDLNHFGNFYELYLSSCVYL